MSLNVDYPGVRGRSLVGEPDMDLFRLYASVRLGNIICTSSANLHLVGHGFGALWPQYCSQLFSGCSYSSGFDLVRAFRQRLRTLVTLPRCGKFGWTAACRMDKRCYW